ncbi:MAG: ABC transporter ATP-binding protein [Pyramidobacter sp.]|jgi:oligopeptide/dipeptide ABC transporter ATP-binding protein
MTEKILQVRNLCRYFDVDGGTVRAVDGVSFDIDAGSTYGLVGESGCGKSTLGRCILRLIEPTSGQVIYEGRDFLKLKGKELRRARSGMQMVFQDPAMSLDPKMRVGETLMEALAIHGTGTREERFGTALDLMLRLGFQKEHFFRFPHQFSGGQKQRIGLARALILRPKLIVCDEPVSALDVSVQAQIVNLLRDVQKSTGVAYLFITHNLSIVRYVSDWIGVMYLGRLVEEGPTEEIFGRYAHPYTEALLSAAAPPDPHVRTRRVTLNGEVPSPLSVHKGCVFASRCPRAQEQCTMARPELTSPDGSLLHRAACFYPLKH